MTTRFARVLFLDVDGVFNSLRSFMALGAGRNFDPVAVRMLEMIIKGCDADVVWSTAWRGGDGWTGENILEGLRGTGVADMDFWGRRGMRMGRPLQTPDLPGESRGQEIRTWIAGRDVARFVILDDDSDMDELTPHLVKTEFDTGLCAHHVEEVFKRFGAEIDVGWSHKNPPQRLEWC